MPKLKEFKLHYNPPDYYPIMPELTSETISSDAPPRNFTVALLGNPNTGKTTLFNALSGLRHHTGNYAGVTVEIKKGRLTVDGRTIHLVDLPGTYSLAPRSPDEMLAVEMLLGRRPEELPPDLIISIVDASNLERNLYLTTQAIELGVPILVVLNMMDIARSRGITIDVEKLRQRLRVAVFFIQANRGIGLEELKQTLISRLELSSETDPARVPFPEAFEEEVQSLQTKLGTEVPEYLVRRLLLDVGGYTEQLFAAQADLDIPAQIKATRERLAQAGCPVPAVEARSRYGWIRQVTQDCLHRPSAQAQSWSDRLDRVLTHRLWGTLVFFGVMFLLFQSIFTVATPLMDLIVSGQTLLSDALKGSLPAGPLTSLLADGIVGGVGAVVIFLPQIFILFAFITILEDCGYMARAAFLMDKLMARCGLSGKSFIPLLSSMACAIPGIMATRVIEQRRDRLATILVAPLMSCSARLPVYVLLIGAFFTVGYAWWVPGLVMFSLYALGIVLAPLVALVLKRTVLRGETPVFVMEMPSFKRPSARLVVRRMWDSGYAFLARAGTLILASMILVWAALYFPHRDEQGRSYEEQIAEIQTKVEQRELKLNEATQADKKETVERLSAELDILQQQGNHLQGEWRQQSYLGQLGHVIEPVVKPLGWDWKIGVAALASFPAREVVVGALGILYQVGEVDAGEIEEAENVSNSSLGRALQEATWDGDPKRKVFTAPVALSLLVFFALCCQCVSTLAIIKRETGTWRWPIFTFVYMTVLAYLGAMLVYQIGSLIA